ncbi:MAG TPA: 4'-phosphopantetheinyl transferase superfamily protein [Myxococcota bacterium]|nr:4'-phosphopantetheinyl transferase superfamily protein [Myxococcota bacterium]
MAILAVGLELVDTPRFERLLARRGERLLARVYSAEERAYAARRSRGHESLGVRLAAKLAARRALGGGIALREIEIVRRRGEAPTLRFHGAAADRARARGVTRAGVTLTHDPAFCVSQVVLEGEA